MQQQQFYIHLTDREQDVLNHVLLGKSAKEIARDLELSFHTIKNHLDEIKNKYQCHSVKKLMAQFIDIKYLKI